jgi:hypothetical protein
MNRQKILSMFGIGLVLAWIIIFSTLYMAQVVFADDISITASVYNCADYTNQTACLSAPITCYWNSGVCSSSAPAPSIFVTMWNSLIATTMGSGGLMLLVRVFIGGTPPKEKIKMIIAGVIGFLILLGAIGIILTVVF